jgi:thymidylate synthase (FAD)
MKLINKKENIFGDDIAFIEQYDFSQANLSEENRIKAITTVKVYVNNKYDILV